jgi:hypothetical protein
VFHKCQALIIIITSTSWSLARISAQLGYENCCNAHSAFPYWLFMKGHHGLQRELLRDSPGPRLQPPKLWVLSSFAIWLSWLQVGKRTMRCHKLQPLLQRKYSRSMKNTGCIGSLACLTWCGAGMWQALWDAPFRHLHSSELFRLFRVESYHSLEVYFCQCEFLLLVWGEKE